MAAQSAGQVALRAGRGVRWWSAAALATITLLALVVRVVSVNSAGRPLEQDIPKHMKGDEVGYEQLAWDLYSGHFFESPERVPVYPMFLAGCYSVLGGRHPQDALYLQTLIGALAVPLTYLLARRFLSRGLSLAAAGLVAVDVYLVDQSERLYTEVLYTPLLVGAVWALLWALGRCPAPRAGTASAAANGLGSCDDADPQPRLSPRPASAPCEGTAPAPMSPVRENVVCGGAGAVPNSLWLRFAFAGLLMAVVTLTRPTAALLALLLPLILPWRWPTRRKLAAWVAYAGAMGLLVAPWTIHNWRQFHRFLPFCTTNAALWHGSPEFYHLNEQGMRLMPIWEKYLVPGRASSIEGDAAFTQRAIDSIKAEPWVYAKYSLRKPLDFWLGNPYAEWPYSYMFKWKELREAYAPAGATWAYSPTHTASMMIWRQLPILAGIAVIVLAARRRLTPFWPLLFLCLYFTAVHTITYAETRYSDPLHPLLIVMVLAAFARFVVQPSGCSEAA